MGWACTHTCRPRGRAPHQRACASGRPGVGECIRKGRQQSKGEARPPRGGGTSRQHIGWRGTRRQRRRRMCLPPPWTAFRRAARDGAAVRDRRGASKVWHPRGRPSKEPHHVCLASCYRGGFRSSKWIHWPASEGIQPAAPSFSAPLALQAAGLIKHSFPASSPHP